MSITNAFPVISEKFSQGLGLDCNPQKYRWLVCILLNLPSADQCSFRLACKSWALILGSIQWGDEVCGQISRNYQGFTIPKYRKCILPSRSSLLNPLFPDFASYLLYIGTHGVKKPIYLESACGKTHFAHASVLTIQNPEYMKNFWKNSIGKDEEARGALYGVFNFQRTMAARYHTGYQVERNYEKALTYFEMAACHRDVNSLYYLTIFYSAGIGTSPDQEKAKYYFSELSKESLASSERWRLGVCYQQGYGCEKDLEKAEYFYLESKSSQGYMGLGKMCEREKVEKAAEYYMRATNFHYPFEALFSICMLDADVHPDYFEETLQISQEESGNPGAWHAFRAHCYRDGTILDKDDLKSSEEWHLAGDHGFAEAQGSLCKRYYENGYKEKASRYFDLLSDPNHPDCERAITKRRQLIAELKKITGF